MQVLSRPPSGWPALVLNADYRPLSYYPLSLWPWQETIKAVFLDRVDVVSSYDKIVHSPTGSQGPFTKDAPLETITIRSARRIDD